MGAEDKRKEESASFRRFGWRWSLGVFRGQRKAEMEEKGEKENRKQMKTMK